ncbi:MAG: DUF362 domain-containing protein [Ignavibacteriales bacterium]|nr:DUF362 domain-containing protein [Ignavibacteriales bacterium]
MDRRTFFRNSLGVSALAGSYLTLGGPKDLFAGVAPRTAAGTVDLVAVRGGEAAQMFQKGIEAFGGIGTFVKKGQKVVIKPNIGWDVLPERGGNTNPKLVAEIIRHCLQAGAKEVVVFDHTCDEWQRCYKNSGIEAAVKDAGGRIAPGHTEGYYHEVAIPKGKVLKQSKEHELVLAADVFINVPVLKHHSSSRITCALKNLMGNVWDRGYWHGNDLHQCIADFGTFRNPTLNVVDAYYVMKRNGPRGVSAEDVVTMKAQLLSTDIVAIDTAAVKMFGSEPKDVRHIQIAAEQGVGRMDLENLTIKRITL